MAQKLCTSLAVCTLVFAGTGTAAQDRAAVEAGEQVYVEHCATCHGAKLRATGAIPDLKQLKADGRARFDHMVLNGRGQMPAWQGIISSDELDQLWAYIRSRATDR